LHYAFCFIATELKTVLITSFNHWDIHVTIHPTIERMKDIVTIGEEHTINDILAESVQFQPQHTTKLGLGARLSLQFWDILEKYFLI
jgi:hypothetical protein